MDNVNLYHFCCLKCVALTESQQNVVSCDPKHLDQQGTEMEFSQSTLVPNSLNAYKSVPNTKKPQELKIKFRTEDNIIFYL